MEINISGKAMELNGKICKTLKLRDEWHEDIEEPEVVIKDIKKCGVRADLFTFWQRLPEIDQKHKFFMEWDYIAAMPIKSYEFWFKNQIKSRTRGLIKKAKKKGLKTKICEFNSEFIEGMVSIFNETPIRQGKPYWHYGKDFATVKREFSRYLYRETLIGAYFKNELIGFIMLSNAERYALTGQIISKIEYRNMAPNNLLIAEAVRICSREKIPYLVYFYWGSGSFAEFKRRSGFERIGLPRYYIPLSVIGNAALRLNLHRGIIGAIPPVMKNYLKNIRRRWYSRKIA